MKTTKKLWSMVLCICLGLTVLCTMPATATDAYADWKLEDGEVITDASAPEGTNYLKLTATYAETVDADGKVTKTGTTGRATKDYIDVTPGKLNVLSFYYKSGADGLAQMTMYQRNDAGENLQETLTIRLSSTGDEWRKIHYAFTPKDGCVKVSLVLDAYYYNAKEAQIACYDGITMTAADDGGLNIPAGETGYYSLKPGFTEVQNKIAVKAQIRAEEACTVKTALQVDPAINEAAMGTKPVTTEWKDLSISGITYLVKGTALKVVADTTAVSLQNVQFEVDGNLLSAGSMEDVSQIGWTSTMTWLKNGRIDGLSSSDTDKLTDAGLGTNETGYKSDGDCPDGVSYLYMTKGTKGYISMGGVHNVLKEDMANTRFLLSFWYKTNNEKGQARVIQRNSSAQYKMPHVYLAKTNGAWRKLEMVIERMPGALVNFYIQFGTVTQTTADTLAEGEYLCYDAVSLVPLPADQFGFYNNTTTPFDGSEDTTFELSDNYSNVLGDVVDTLDGATEVTAVYADGSINDASDNKISTKRVLLAAYTKDSNNVPQLVSVSFSTVDAEATTVQYPAAMLNTADFAEGTEIRAFIWDSISGLKPLEAAIAITK